MAITRFLNRLKPLKSYPPLPLPQQPLCIIGDIHGCADLLDDLVLQICTQGSVQGMRVVLVGDLIDRGPYSAGVLARVRDWVAKPAPFAEVTCLMGNHEAMLLAFLSDPVQHGARWLAHGGDATLQSFGLSSYHRGKHDTMDARMTGLRDALREVFPAGLEPFLQKLPQLWQEQALVVSHAGADPARPIGQQTAKSLLWGHPWFLSRPRQDGIWIVHGHVITPEPTAQAGRIAVDTGAWRSGQLTAALLDQDGLRFVST